MAYSFWRRWLIGWAARPAALRRHNPRRITGRLLLETLEDRIVPTTFNPTYRVYQPDGPNQPFATAAPVGYTPIQIKGAYGFNAISFAGSISGDGKGQTIAIVDAHDNPNILNDLKSFSLQFNLPDPTPLFTKIDQNGGTNYPSLDKGWAGEIALDVEWVHALAPAAKIVLVEANTALSTDLLVATDTARSRAGVSVVSMSFGGGESPQDLTDNGTYTTPAGHQGVTFVAATGDTGKPGGYPAYSPNVLAVGGTTLNLTGSTYLSETGWSSSGGGISTLEPQPAYQAGVVTQDSTHRTIPDVAFQGDPQTGVPVYDTVNNPVAKPWYQVGGTSFSCPAWATIIAIANQGRAVLGLSSLDGVTDTLPKIYKLSAADFHDIVSGNNGFPAGPGYDLVTGRGSPYADRVVRDLDIRPTPPTFAALAVTPNPINEGGSTVLTGSFTDLNQNQTHTVTVNWGDGSIPTTASLAAGVSTIGTFTHQYLDNGPLPTQVWTITVTLANGNEGTVSSTVGVQVLNLPPTATLRSSGSVRPGNVETFTFSNQADPSPVDVAAGFTYSFDFQNDGSFSDPGDVLNARSPVATHVFTTAGTTTVHGRITDKDGGFTDYTTTFFVGDFNIIAVGADAGGGPRVTIYNATTGKARYDFYPFDPGFAGGVRVAVGDFTGTGIPDVVTAAGPGGTPQVRIFNSVTGQQIPGPLGNFFAFDPSFDGGVQVAAGDVNGDGIADLIVGADAGGGPHVKIFDGATGAVIGSFFAYGASFTGGVRVAAADVNGDGKADVIVGAGPGGGPHVKVFNGATGGLMQSFFAYDPSFSAGIYVAAGDVMGTGFAQVITGPGNSGGPVVRVFDGTTAKMYDNFLALSPDVARSLVGSDFIWQAGTRVGVADINGDGRLDIVAGAGLGATPQVRSYDAVSLTRLDNFFALDNSFLGGIYVAGR